jgi:opacity protein-like surface antigen
MTAPSVFNLGSIMLNKKCLPAIALLAMSMVSAAASAQVYVDASIGSGKWTKNCAGEVKCTSGTAVKFTGGYTLDKNFALEASVFTLGNHSTKLVTPTIFHMTEGRTNGVSLAGVFNYEFSEGFSGFAKLGIASLREKDHWTNNRIDPGMVTFSETSSTHLMLGAGLKYKLNDKVSLTLELDQFRLKSNYQKPAARALTVGAQYAF